jgi:hypothetical protein
MNREEQKLQNKFAEEFAAALKEFRKTNPSQQEVADFYSNYLKKRQIAPRLDDLAKLNAGDSVLVKGGTNLGERVASEIGDISNVKNIGKRGLRSFRPTLGGLGALAATAALGSSDNAMAQGLDRALTEGDPMDMIMGGREAGENSDIIPKELVQQKMKEEQERRQADIDKMQNVRDVAKYLGGSADVNPKMASEMVGEKELEEDKKTRFDDLRRRMK